MGYTFMVQFYSKDDVLMAEEEFSSGKEDYDDAYVECSEHCDDLLDEFDSHYCLITLTG
jgi:hypothetical protein